MRSTRRLSADSRKTGNVVVVALLVVTLLVALATAQFAVIHRNVQASSYFLSYSDLHKYAEGGIAMAVHDLTYDVSGTDGNIGTANWTPTNDVGRDGVGGTYDKGEGDGMPTRGEPNAYPMCIGNYHAGLGLLVHVSPTAFTDIFHVTSTATSNQGDTTVETYVRRSVATMPRVGAVYVDPKVALDLKGSKFTIDGRDREPNWTLNANPPKYGLSTLQGPTAGTNKAVILAQIPSKNYGQITGEGTDPSLGEVTGIDLPTLFEGFKAGKTQDAAPGTYNDPDFGKWSTEDFRVTYCNGDLHLSGTGQGAGVLVVEGTLTVTGEYTHYGLVICKGDIRLAGGGAVIHTLGSVFVGQTLTAIDPVTEVAISGNADLWYSSAVLTKIEQKMKAKYLVVYYDEK